MIGVVTCTCGSSEGLARKILRESGLNNWMDIPVIRGKDLSKRQILPYQSLTNARELLAFISNHSKYVVVYGYDADNNVFEWRDCASGSVKEKIEAEALIKAFA